MNRPPLILASTSRYRAELLGRLGIPFTAVAPGVDEAAAGTAAEPRQRAIELARAKAAAVAAVHPGAIVIGSDQVCALGGEVLHKPGDHARAAAQLRRLAGRAHHLHTAVAVRSGSRLDEFADCTELRLRALDDAEIERYLRHDRPYDCAGSYRIEGLGIALFDALSTGDPTAIIGLPLLRLAACLRAHGLPVP